MTTSFSPSRVRRRFSPRQRTALTAALFAVTATVAAMVAGVAPAHAAHPTTPQSRDAEPIAAGSRLGFAGSWCTAGLVLKDNSTLGAITEYRRSVRFILSAGHCGTVGEQVDLPDGSVVGDVVWKSATHDFLLVRVEPKQDYGYDPGCLPGSQSLPCVSISSHYYPRAVGNVFTGGAPLSSSVPVNGTTMSGTTFCISGAFSGTVCGHQSTPRPDNQPADPPEAQDLSFTTGPMVTVNTGDSGAPLVTSDAQIFGIDRGGWGDENEPLAGLLYTKVSVFFAEQSGYALAPSA